MDEMTSGLSQDGFQTLDDYKSDTQLTLFDMKELAVNKTKTLSQIQEEIKKLTEMLNDGLQSDPQYKEKEESLKGKKIQLNSIKLQLVSQPSQIALIDKLRGLKNEAKEKKAEISTIALEVLRQSRNNQFELNGDTYEISTVAKLVKTKQ